MLLNEVRDYLSATLNLTVSGETFVVRTGKMPDAPDAAIVVEEGSSGMPSIRAMGPSGTAPIFEQPAINVWVRGPRQGYEIGRQMAERVYQALDGQYDLVLSGVRYASIQALCAPFLDEQDRNERDTIVCTYLIKKERSAA